MENVGLGLRHVRVALLRLLLYRLPTDAIEMMWMTMMVTLMLVVVTIDDEDDHNDFRSLY